MDETEEYMQMNDAYKKRVVQTLRDPMTKVPQNMAVDPGESNMQDAGQHTAKPGKSNSDKILKDPYGNTLRGKISDAMSKYMGPKDPMQ